MYPLGAVCSKCWCRHPPRPVRSRRRCAQVLLVRPPVLPAPLPAPLIGAVVEKVDGFRPTRHGVALFPPQRPNPDRGSTRVTAGPNSSREQNIALDRSLPISPPEPTIPADTASYPLRMPPSPGNPTAPAHTAGVDGPVQCPRFSVPTERACRKALDPYEGKRYNTGLATTGETLIENLGVGVGK
jgi:hypothetical protein